jgi:hypothetical protein
MGVEQLAASLTRLQDALAEVRLPLDVPDADEHRELVRVQSAQIEDYVLPRLRRLDAPLLTVVGGSTGAGKSTLVNSLVGRVVTTPGVIRPTTRSSVLVHHPDDARWFESGQILPGLARSDSPVTDPRVLQLVPEPGLPKGLAILDAPDVDSVVAQNRTLAAQLLAAADLWLFVTSAARYADAVPWKYLRAAARRKAVVAVVLDRVPPAAMSDVPPHLGQMMSQRGLSASPLFAVPETTVDDAGLLPDASVAPIRGWLADLAEDTVRRNQVVLQTLDGAIESLAAHGPELVAAIAAQTEALDTLRADAEKSFAEAVRSVAAQTADGTMLRGEVLARWQDFVGTGEFFRAMEKRIGLFRDRLVQVAKGEPKKAQDVQLAVESGLEVLIREEGEFAARRVVSAWEAHPAGRQLLDQDGALGKVSLDFGASAARVIRQWQGDVLELVGTEGKGKKATARYLALGVNGAGVALMVFVFSQTGGLVGAEVGVAGGTALLAQRVLEAVFGEDAVRRLAKQAKEQLDSRVEGLMAIELARFEKLIDDVDVRSQHGDELGAAIAALEVERVAEERYIRESGVGASLPEPSEPTAVIASSEPTPVEPAVVVPGTEFAAQEADAADPGVDEDADGEIEAESPSDTEAADLHPEPDSDVAGEQAGETRSEARVYPAASPDEQSIPASEQPGNVEAPQRFVEGDTGLLPALVSAQLSALAAGAARRGEGDETTDLSGDGVEAEPGAVTESDDQDHGRLPVTEPVMAVEERPIPVPVGLAALAAEAVRRPGELRTADEVSVPADQDASGDANAVDPDGDAADPAEPGQGVAGPEDAEQIPPASLPGAPVLPSAPIPAVVDAVDAPQHVAPQRVATEQGEDGHRDTARSDVEPSEASSAQRGLPAAPFLPPPPAPPMTGVGQGTSAEPMPQRAAEESTEVVHTPAIVLQAPPALLGGGLPPTAAAAPGLPGAPALPVPPTIAPRPDGGADDASNVLTPLAPPELVPPAPPVPRWPEPEDESVDETTGEETS